LTTVQPLLDSAARVLKLDMAEFSRCQRRQAISSLVESDIQQANKAGVRSTPSFLIGDFLVEGAIPYPDFRRAVDTALVLAHNAKRPH
jgi:predicted DsbA family dithiol-disulfide isomerase